MNSGIFVSLSDMKNISIKERLILYFVLLSFISIAIISLFSIFEAKKGITDRTFSQLIILRDLRKEQINTLFATTVDQLKALAASEGIIRLAANRHSNAPSFLAGNELTAEKPVLDLVSDSRYCKSLFLISVKGETIRLVPADAGQELKSERNGTMPDTAFMAGFKNQSPVPEQIIFEQTDSLHSSGLFIAIPVYDAGGKCSAFILFEMNPEAIHRIMVAKYPGSGFGESGEVYLVGTDGLMRSPSRFLPDAVMKQTVATHGFTEAVTGKEGEGIYDDYRGIKILGAYGFLKIGGIERVILAEIDVKEAMVPLSAIRNEILLLSLFIGLVIFMIAWFVAHSITRPLVRLKKAADFIAEGNYQQQLEIPANDEIGDLTRAFNAMSFEISAKTQVLKESEERLRQFYQATMDGIILHQQGNMLLFNSAMLNLTGYSADEFSSFKVLDIIQVRKLAECEKDSIPRTFESVLLRKDGSELPVEIQESCVEYQGKSVRASVIRDISARKKMEAELADERNKRIRAVFDGQDQERRRLSRELHDGLGQQLAAGKLFLESRLYLDDPAELKSGISDAQHIFDQIISDIRRISHDLSPSILQEFGLKTAMENLCKNFRTTSGIHLGFQYIVVEDYLDDTTSTYLFRILQEGLNNIHRHSGAVQARVTVQQDNYGILLQIEDDGAGFRLRDIAGKGGNGLYNIRERVNILKGNLSIKSQPGKGTIIQVRVPGK
jgi:PAS domain S-box-containing protein